MELKVKFYVILLFVLAFSLKCSFTIGRIKYEGGGDWYSDPTSLTNLLNFYHKYTNVKTDLFAKDVSIMDDDFFNFPYLYLTGHGRIIFKKEEINRLRKHLLGGGFLHIDDNYGLDKYIRKEIKKLFPQKKLSIVPLQHPIYTQGFKMVNGLPKIHKHNGKRPQGLGIFHNERLVLYYSYESDLGDGWEDQEVHNIPQKKRKLALQMGFNLINYFLKG